jgi:hypothetical protein
MERTAPSTGSEEIELYQRTYYSLLRSSAEVKIRTLEEVHAGMNSLLHPAARDPVPDMPAFLYSLLRLPACISDVRLVVLGQSTEVFSKAGYRDLDAWQEVNASARRRRCFFNGKDTLACFISSRSDIDDMIPLLTAYQIEWNKLHQRLQDLPQGLSLHSLDDTLGNYAELAEILEIPEEDFDRLYAVWDEDFGSYLERITAAPCDFRVQLLSGSLVEYRRATHAWWEHIEQTVPQIRQQPVYFVSSNVHSMLNVLTGFAQSRQEEMIRYLASSGNTGLLNEWKDIQAGRLPSSRDNFLYYVLKKYQQSPQGRGSLHELRASAKALGIAHVPSRLSFDVEAQVFELSHLNPEAMDARLQPELASGLEGLHPWLAQSDALILNIDYPLGLAAYDLLSEVASHAGAVLGVYLMGKAATLNAVMGDVMISNVVHDEHSLNTYLFSNCFCSADIAPDVIYGTVLDNQKAVSVQGTFLQTATYMDVFYREGYTVIEMETGPYLSAVYEMFRPKRHPVNEIVNLHGLPFDLGVVHYASDTPLGKGRNLGAGSLSYHGMDSTYAATLAILRRIFHMEKERLRI